MIVCTNCGHHNEDAATFCASCGTYLAWTGARPEQKAPGSQAPGSQAPEPGGAAAPRPPDPAPPPGAGEREGAAEAGADGGSAPAPAGSGGAAGAGGGPAAATGAAAPPGSPAPPGGQAAAAAPAGGPEAAAPAGTAAAGPDAGEAEQPAARQPGQAQRRRVRRGPVAAPPVPEGPLRCWNCGTGNPATRRFCVRCGADLHQVPAARPSWWRRLLHRLQGSPRPAGTRPRRWAPGRLLRPLALVLAVALAVGLAGPWRGTVVRPVSAGIAAVRRAVLKPVPVSPVGFAASSSLPRHGPELVGDGLSNTFWAEGADGTGAGQVLQLTFSEPVDLTRVIIRSGASGKPGEFKQQPRPRRLVLAAGRQRATLQLSDSPDPQTFSVKLRRVRTLEVRIASVYQAPSGRSCSIAEIELWRLRT
ncbi:MAG TPA: zinc ribbon domain-containing protein [Actinomycetes bacterium]|nr:zinc ribbon domain-containing protein [Actinomycetes bacterium]